MSDGPLISVIIPVYNTGKYLYKCIDSVLNQTYSNLQIIIVDDGSTDDSPNVCDEYAQIDNRIIVIHKQNEGVSIARNTGINIATGDYFYFPDSDDYIELDTFEYLLRLVKLHQCDIISFEYFITYTDHELIHSCDQELYGLFDRAKSQKAVIEGIPFAWNRFYSKKAVDGVRFRDNIFRGEDSLYVHECIEQIDSMWFDKRPLYHYVQSRESACRGKFRTVQLTGLMLYDEYRRIFEIKYPELWNCFRKDILHLYITLYYDMYADDVNYLSEMINVYEIFQTQYKEIKNSSLMSKKEKIKFLFFDISPNLFCKIHKLIHKL